MDKLQDLITDISKRPEIYLGKPSVERLYAFISGYLYQNENIEDHCLEGFNQYVAELYGIKTNHNWASIIPFFSNSEEEAFATFVKLFHSFINK